MSLLLLLLSLARSTKKSHKGSQPFPLLFSGNRGEDSPVTHLAYCTFCICGVFRLMVNGVGPGPNGTLDDECLAPLLLVELYFYCICNSFCNFPSIMHGIGLGDPGDPFQPCDSMTLMHNWCHGLFLSYDKLAHKVLEI